MTNASPPEPPARRGRGPSRRTLLIALTLTAAVGAGGGAAVGLRGHDSTVAVADWVGDGATGVPEPGVTTAPPTPTAATLPASYRVPGAAPRLPWPATGQAHVEVQGIGPVGSSGGQTPRPIASVTKVMTAYVILRDHPLEPGAAGPTLTVTAAEAARYPRERAEGQSLVPVQAGERLTERQALIALLLPSADNVARILARWDAGSIEAFVAKMNATAADLGMRHTRYTDPSGLDAATTSTAADQVRLGHAALRSAALRQIVRLPSATIPVAGTVTNYNRLLGRSGVIGLKTGSMSAAGGCLLFAATRRVDGRTVTIVGAVFGQHGSVLSGLPQALSASERLITAVGAALDTHRVLRAGQPVAMPDGGRVAVPAQDLTVVGWPGLTYRLSTPDGGTVAAVSPAGTATTVRTEPA
ncbi:D-alanyl-D-alanine carboxypeptidase family protein [Plantactinospora siamensis]|uniref:D-alanyl-D-alanine carboxypeptidase family protein n=1 Tax=Plantactinospora siamensis TaxID=555372 RepID=A0ABV6NVU8_9ACTN